MSRATRARHRAAPVGGGAMRNALPFLIAWIFCRCRGRQARLYWLGSQHGWQGSALVLAWRGGLASTKRRPPPGACGGLECFSPIPEAKKHFVSCRWGSRRPVNSCEGQSRSGHPGERRANARPLNQILRAKVGISSRSRKRNADQVASSATWVTGSRPAWVSGSQPCSRSRSERTGPVFFG